MRLWSPAGQAFLLIAQNVPAEAQSESIRRPSATASVSASAVAVAENRPVVFDYDETRIDTECAKERCDGAIPIQLPGGAVHRQGDCLAPFQTMNHRLKYSA